MTEEYLLLKWGTLKGWSISQNEKACEAFDRWANLGVSMGAMQQHDTPEQKAAICDMIDAVNGTISNDWSGETMTKDEAKKYVMEYGRAKA